MRYLIILMFLMSCGTFKRREDRVISCTIELTEIDAPPQVAAKICSDIITRNLGNGDE